MANLYGPSSSCWVFCAIWRWLEDGKVFTCSHHATVHTRLEHPLALIPMVYFASSPQTLRDNYVLFQKRWEKKQVPLLRTLQWLSTAFRIRTIVLKMMCKTQCVPSLCSHTRLLTVPLVAHICSFNGAGSFLTVLSASKALPAGLSGLAHLSLF